MKPAPKFNAVKLVITLLVLGGFAVPLLWVVAIVLYALVVRKGRDVAAMWFESHRNRHIH